jgi:hypothetical protein
MEARSVESRSGWVTLAALLCAIAGAFTAISGPNGLGVAPGDIDREVFGEASDWILGILGTAGLIVGVLQLLTGIGIWLRLRPARIAGMVLAVTALLLDLSYHRALDGWGLGGLAVNLAIVVILAVEESEFRRHVARRPRSSRRGRGAAP